MVPHTAAAAAAAALLLLGYREYADFRVSSDGELQGVGLLIANEPVNKHLLVLSAIKGGPADRAGITSGGRLGSGSAASRVVCSGVCCWCLCVLSVWKGGI